MTLCVENLTITHQQSGRNLSSPLNFTIEAGSVLTLMGPSGCGKSTLLSALAGHLAADFTLQGRIWLAGQDVGQMPAHHRQIGILFQDDLLFPHLNVWENLAFALPNSVKGKQRKQQALQALAELELLELANAFPPQISGGQRARISLTRMLLAKPKLALLDEPFSKLDATLRAQFRDWVVNQLSQAAIPALMVTHDQQDVPRHHPILNWPMEAPYA